MTGSDELDHLPLRRGEAVPAGRRPSALAAGAERVCHGLVHRQLRSGRARVVEGRIAERDSGSLHRLGAQAIERGKRLEDTDALALRQRCTVHAGRLDRIAAAFGHEGEDVQTEMHEEPRAELERGTEPLTRSRRRSEVLGPRGEYQRLHCAAKRKHAHRIGTSRLLLRGRSAGPGDVVASGTERCQCVVAVRDGVLRREQAGGVLDHSIGERQCGVRVDPEKMRQPSLVVQPGCEPAVRPAAEIGSRLQFAEQW